MRVSSYVFFCGMVDSAVGCKLFANTPIDAAFVGSEMRLARRNANDQRADSLSRDIRDVERASLAVTFHKREHCLFGSGALYARFLTLPPT